MSRLPCPAELWPTFSALLDQALQLPESGRQAWFDGLDAEYAALKPALARVLAGALRLGAQQFQAGAGAGQAGAAADTEFEAGQSIGPYVLERPLGQGGMGEVWLANRGDGQLKRPVALKLPYPHLLAGAARRRFERERDILAALAHPHIAQLYDAGVSDTGHPYLAMEWVEGLPLTRYCRDAGSSIAQRLELFRQILEAVHYAHMHFVAHRDLKPSNILVTAQGQVKLLDFGIAKLLEGGEGSEPTELTRLAGRVLTPNYAAPEQLAGGTVTTASDVYSLGVLLFELLTGQRPFERAPAPGQEASAASSRISAADPPPCGLDARALRRALRGDLDAIIAKALAPDPARRYSSALTFAADLERHAVHLPIAARHIGRLAQVGKFLLRHRLGAAAVAALVLSIAAGVIGVAWQGRLAQREAGRETAVKNFLIGIFKASDPRLAQDKPRDQITAKELLDIGAQRAGSGFFGDADAQIELLGTLAEIYYELGDKDHYATLRQQQLQLAAARHGDDNSVAIDGLLFEATRAADLEGDDAKARLLLDRADEAMRRSGQGNPVQRAQWWLARAMTLSNDRKTAAAQRQALLNAIRLYSRYAPGSRYYAEALGELGNYYGAREADHGQAARYFRASIAAFDRDDDPDRSQEAEAYSDLGGVLFQLGELDQSDQAYSRGLELMRETYGEAHPLYWIPAAAYATTMHWRGDRERAMQMFERLRAAIPTKDAQTLEAVDASESYAFCLIAEGRAAEAVPLLEAAERSYAEKALTADRLPRVRGRLGVAYELVGRRADARRELKWVLDAYMAMHKTSNAQLLRSRERWGHLLLEDQDLDGAETQFREVARWTSVRDQGQLYVALANGGLAQIAQLRQDNAAALQYIRLAEQTYDGIKAGHDVRWGPYLWLIHARILRQAGDNKAAAEWAARALEADQRYDAPSSPDIAQAQALLQALGQLQTAETVQAAH